MLDRIKSEYWYWQWEITHRGLPQQECGFTGGLCPWCRWKVDLRHAGWFLCGNCGKEFYCLDSKGTRIEIDLPQFRWTCFHPKHTPYLPKDILDGKDVPPPGVLDMDVAQRLAPSAFADLHKYWKHGHIILWKRLRMHARRWGLLKD